MNCNSTAMRQGLIGLHVIFFWEGFCELAPRIYPRERDWALHQNCSWAVWGYSELRITSILGPGFFTLGGLGDSVSYKFHCSARSLHALPLTSCILLLPHVTLCAHAPVKRTLALAPLLLLCTAEGPNHGGQTGSRAKPYCAALYH